MSTNPDRSRRCDRAILGYGGDLPESNLIDFLADAMHWCDRNGENFHRLLAQACRHYRREVNDRPEDEGRSS